jgi:hypothetical protein
MPKVPTNAYDHHRNNDHNNNELARPGCAIHREMPQRRGRRCPKPIPRKLALSRSAASVRFIFFAISITGVRAFECALRLAQVLIRPRGHMTGLFFHTDAPQRFGRDQVEKVPAPDWATARGKPARIQRIGCV